MTVFAILTGLCAVYFGVVFDWFLRAGLDRHRPARLAITETLAWIFPVFVCGAVQYWRLRREGASRHWFAIGRTALGAPIAGIVLMLIVSFAIFSRR